MSDTPRSPNHAEPGWDLEHDTIVSTHEQGIWNPFTQTSKMMDVNRRADGCVTFDEKPDA